MPAESWIDSGSAAAAGASNASCITAQQQQQHQLPKTETSADSTKTSPVHAMQSNNGHGYHKNHSHQHLFGNGNTTNGAAAAASSTTTTNNNNSDSANDFAVIDGAESVNASPARRPPPQQQPRARSPPQTATTHHHVASHSSLFGVVGHTGNGYQYHQPLYLHPYHPERDTVLPIHTDLHPHRHQDENANSYLLALRGAPLHEVKSNSPNGHSAGSLQSPSGSANKISPNRDGREASLLKDREERLRYLRERQAGDRHRKLEELKSAAMQAQKYRELQEEDRRRKIEEIKYRDLERRHLVEERKKQIWEAERNPVLQDRRDTMLRKSQEREARIEAMRNAQRSSIGFAFGSCTPRMLDMESSLVFNRRSSSQHNLIPGAVLSRTQSAAPAGVSCTDNGDGVSDVPVRKRTSSTYSLNHRNRESAHRHTIHEAFFWENSTSPASSDTVADESRNTHAQTNGGPTVVNYHRHHNSEITPNHSIGARQGALSALFPWDNSSLYHAPQFGGASNTTDGGNHRLSGVLSGSGVMVGGEDLMTKSLTSLASSLHRGRRKTDLIPTVPLKGEVTNAARTRSPAPSSPSRPHSSMSQQSLSSHASQASSVSMRARSAPRRPRPMSVAGSMPDKPVTSDERQGRSSEKKATVPTGKPPRAKSVGADQIAKELESAAPKASPAAAAPAPSRRPPSSGAPKAARTVAATPKERPKIAPKPLALRKQTSKTSPVSSPTEELQVSLEKAVGMTNGSLINHQHPLNGFSEPSDSTR